ncbi:MAG: hypothetical protein WBM77_10200 [Maribacter sp.]
MKSITKKLQFVIIMALLLSTSTVVPNNSNGEDEIEVNTADDLIGAWSYTVENVDFQYSTGVLLITKEEGKYNVQVQLSAGIIPGEDIEVNDNKISFAVYIEGQKVSVSLMADGDKIEGESSSSDGVYKIEGTKVMPE